MYEKKNYNFDYDILDWDTIKQMFPVKNVLQEYMGVDIKRNRCACPIHGGKNLSMQVYDTSAKCYSKCQESFSAFDLVKQFDGLDSTYEAILHLCDFYGIDPTSFDGIELRQQTNTSQKPKQQRQTISISKDQLNFMGLSVNPFRRRKVSIIVGQKETTNTRGRKVKTPIMKQFSLSDQECAYIVMAGITHANKEALQMIKGIANYLRKAGVVQSGAIESLIDFFDWRKPIIEQATAIGTIRPGQAIHAIHSEISEKTVQTEILKQMFLQEKYPFCQNIQTYLAKDTEYELTHPLQFLPSDHIESLTLLDGIPEKDKEELSYFLALHHIDKELPYFINENVTDNHRAIVAQAEPMDYLEFSKEKLLRWKDASNWTIEACKRLEPFTVGKYEDMNRLLLSGIDAICQHQLELVDKLVTNIRQLEIKYEKRSTSLTFDYSLLDPEEEPLQSEYEELEDEEIER